jgi:hypothetical protein
MSDIGAHKATPFAELERQMMDPIVPKNEREWWSWREINNLRDTITRLTAEVERLNKENALGGVIHSLFGTFLTPERCDCLAAKNARIEQLEAALESIVKHCNANGMQRWPIALKATAALTQEKPND